MFSVGVSIYGLQFVISRQSIHRSNTTLYPIFRVLHFATEAEAEIEAGEDKLSKMKYGVGSSCIDFALDHLWSSTIRELLMSKFGMSEDAARKFWVDNKQLFIDSIAIIDHRLFISKDKDQFTQEVSDLVDKDNTNKTVLDIIGVMNGAYHNLYYYLRNDEKLRNIIFSTHVWNCNYQYVDTEREDMIAHLVGFLSHPETWMGGYMQNAANYPLELLEYFDKVISRGGVDLVKYAFGSARDKLVAAESSDDELDEGESRLLSCIENLLGEMEKGELYVGTSAVRFGSGKLTPEEREALRELLLAMRVEAGITCGSMRTLVKAIMLGLLKRKDIDTEEEALEELPDILKKLITRYHGDNSATFSDFEKKIYDNEFETYIDRVKKTKPTPKDEDIDKFVDKLKSLYKGSAKSGLMRILAGKLFGSGRLDIDCKTEQISAKLEELKSSMEVEGDSPDDILVTFTKLLKFAPEYTSNLGTLAEKLQNMYLGVQTTRLMRSLANSIFGRLGKDCEDNDVVTELQRLKSLHDTVSQEKDESSSSSNESGDNEQSRLSGESDGSSSEKILEAFTALVEHASRYADPNSFASLATKLRSMFMGSITSGLMHTLASSILGSLGENCDDDDIVLELHKLKKLHELKDAKSGEDDESESNGSTYKDEESKESLDAYTALVEHAPRYADVNCFASLATKLQNMHMGSETAGLMQSFASKMVEHYLVADSKVLEDIDTITQEIEALNQQYKSTLDSETGNLKSDSTSSNTVQQAFLALLTHKQDIDIPSLASLVHYHALNNEATFDRNFSLLEKYIKRKFHKKGHLPDGCTVFVYSRDDDGNRDILSKWWSDVIGYTEHRGKIVPSYKKASNEQMKRLKSIGVTDNFTAIDAAIESAKHDKARGKMGSAVASVKQSTVSLLDDLLPGGGSSGPFGGRGPFDGRGRGGRGRAVRGRVPPGRGRGGRGRMV